MYRTAANADPTANPTYYYVGEAKMSAGSFTDTQAQNTSAATLDASGIGSTGQYQYYVSYYNTKTNTESRPVLMQTPISVDSSQRIHLTDLPALPAADAGEYDETRIYRVATIRNVNGTSTYTDNLSDDLLAKNAAINLDGPAITTSTLLKDVVSRNNSTYSNVFDFTGSATLQFTGAKGGRTLTEKDFTITDTTTVLDLTNFLQNALGIQTSPGSDPSHPIPPDANSGNNPGAYVQGGKILLVGNNGVDNAISIGLSGMKLVTSSGTAGLDLPFASTAKAAGVSTETDFTAYDSLGIPVSVSLTAVLESRTSTSTTYRWFADSGDNQPTSGADIAVGTGLITFDGQGNFTSATSSNISIDRENVASAKPLTFGLDFSQISGLSNANSTLAVSRQDGSAPGTLTSYTVADNGLISGVFSNGITRDLGQLRLARFGNPGGLVQEGSNMYAAGVNSGLPVEGDPSQQGIGSIVAGAKELSNTDVGGNLIDLILASTMYRGNARVITTTQQLFDELLNLRTQ
jgi:flagellar hook protein FlgE